MEILVLVKPVPEPESRLQPTGDGSRFDPDGVKFVLAGYDESAVEQALLLAEANPGTRVRAATYGPAPRSEEVLRACLALGCSSAAWIESPPGREPDLPDTVAALALAVERFPTELVLLGKQSGDFGEGGLATALAARLGREGFGAVVELTYDAPRALFTFGRPVEGALERWEAPGPIVLGLQQAANDPRTAKLQNILKSRRMPIDKVAAAEVAPKLPPTRATRPLAFRLPPPRTGARMIPAADPEAAAAELVRRLRDEAKVLP